MGSNPINLAIRFLLELIALITSSMWGWRLHDAPINYLLAFSVPVLFALIWGTFAIPNDPSRSGKAPIPTNGIIRLLIELSLFGFSIFAVFELFGEAYAIPYGSIIIIHYAVSYDRIMWMLTRRNLPKKP